MNRSVSREHWHQHVAASVHERNRTEGTAAARDMIPSKRHTLAMHAPGQVKQEFFKYPTPEYNFNYVDQLISGDMTELQSSTASTKYRRLLFNIVPPKVCYVRAHRRVRRIALLLFSLFLPGGQAYRYAQENSGKLVWRVLFSLASFFCDSLSLLFRTVP